MISYILYSNHMTVQRLADIQELPRIDDRMTFVFIEHCSINVDGGSIKVMTEAGYRTIPSAAITSLILGPGSSITHTAVKLLAQSGTSLVWMGSDQTRFYAFGRSLSTSAKLVIAQAEIVSHPIKRLQCARQMYAIRFPDDDFNLGTMQAMMRKEGTRMKRVYRDNANRVGINWDRRKYRPGDFDDSDVVNQCLTAGTQIIYAVETGIVNALNVCPSLGVIHNGKSNAFIYDMADLFKTDMVIPVAFDLAKDAVYDEMDSSTIEAEMRKRIREKMRVGRILQKSIAYIMQFFAPGTEIDENNILWFDDVTKIWAGESNESLSGGTNRGL